LKSWLTKTWCGTLEDWTEALCTELGLDPSDASQKTVLNLARVVAHTVDRPAAPLTAYFLGVAVGRGLPGFPGRSDEICGFRRCVA
jgi:hypothetical protein